MKINIKGADIELQYRMRMYLMYEEKTGKSFTFDESASFTAISKLLYCAIASTLEHKKYRSLGLTLTWEEFLDWTDEHNPNDLIQEFNKWLLGIMQAQADKTKHSKADKTERDPNS